MLTSRLRSCRGIRAQHSGLSCHAPVAHAGIVGRGLPATLARTHATESNKADEEASTEGVEPENLFTKHVPRKPRRTKTVKAKGDTQTPKSTGSRKKGASSPTADAADSGVQESTSKAGNKKSANREVEADTMKILREATLLLRDFQANPGNFAAKKPSGGKGVETTRSLKKHFPPARAGPKYDERQTKIFHETLTVLGDALQIYAQSTTGKEQQSHKDIVAAKDAMAQAQMANSRMFHASKEGSEESEEKTTADTEQKQSPKSKAEPVQKSKEKSSERPERKEATRQSVDSQGSPKKNARLLQKSANARARKEKENAKEKGTLDRQPLMSDTVSETIATAVSRTRTGPRARRVVDKKSESTSNTELAKKKKHEIRVENFSADPASALKPIEFDMKSVPLIQYGLDRVLFKEGVYPLQDPRTRVWNFDPYLANIMPVTEFDFDALKEYITSSKDQKLIGVTKDQKKKYTGSTSSMTSTLAHFHFLLSQWRPINCARMSQQFDVSQEGFSSIMKSPAATILNYKDGVYAIDADKEWDSETVLSMLGKSMEKLLTVPKEEFVKYHRSKSHELTDEEKGQEESYHYTTYGDFMMRSQLDAYDPRLPGTGVYDLKTRAVVSIRMDAINVQKGTGYEIRQRDGNWESFEREYFDMIRSAFLKYSLQVRMGRMDGIFVAFHNTERIFGFQYIPLEEMDLSLHGTTDTTLGDREFTASLKLFNELLNQATAKFPEQSLRVHVETRPSAQVPFLYFFAEPVSDEQIKSIQERGKGQIEKFKSRLGIPLGEKENAEVDSAIEEVDDAEDTAEVVKEEEPNEEGAGVEVEEEDSEQVWEDMMDVIEDTIDKDAEGITAIREAIQEALGQSGLLRAKSSEEAQHYIEALLKSIVNSDAELAKTENQNEQEDDEVIKQTNKVEVVEPLPEPKKSTLGSFFSWLRPSDPATESSTRNTNQEDNSPEDTPPEEKSPQDALPEDGADTIDATKAPESGPSPELVELLVKLTSRVGTTSNGKTATEKAKQKELSDDQARLRAFESILLDMMPNVLESAVEEAEEKEAPAVETSNSPASATSQEPTAEKDSLFAMYVTVRNKVNNEPVDRPENLGADDTWDIEYAMEELHGERAEKLYMSCKARRKTALNRDGKNMSFKSLFDGALPKYINAGKTFRSKEDKIARTQPVWIVGQPAPLPWKEVFKGAGAKLVHVLPSLENVRPTEHLGPSKDQGPPSQHAKSSGKPQTKVADDKERADQDAIADSVAELRKAEEDKASSFKEWREKSRRQENS